MNEPTNIVIQYVDFVGAVHTFIRCVAHWWLSGGGCLLLVPGHYVYIRNPYRIDSFKINFLWVKGSKVTKLMGFFFAMIVAEIIRSVVPSVKNNRAHQPSNWRPTPNSGYTNNNATTTYSAHRRSLDKITISASKIGYLLPNHNNENRIFRVLSTKTTRISTGVSSLLVFLFVCCSCPCILLVTLINHFVAISLVPFNLFHLGRMCCVVCATVHRTIVLNFLERDNESIPKSVYAECVDFSFSLAHTLTLIHNTMTLHCQNIRRYTQVDKSIPIVGMNVKESLKYVHKFPPISLSGSFAANGISTSTIFEEKLKQMIRNNGWIY